MNEDDARMAMVMALHPAPVAYVPKRKRNEEAGLVTMRTPVTVREAGRDGFDPVPVTASLTGIPETGLLRDDEGLWRPIRRMLGGRQDENVGRDALVSYLDGSDGTTSLQSFFRCTPLAAPCPESAGTNPLLWRSHRGKAHDMEAARSVRLDGRDRASASLAAYVARDIRILTGGGLPDRAYARFVPALAMIRPPQQAFVAWRIPYGINWRAARGLVCQPADAPALRDLARDLGLPEGEDADVEAIAGALGPGDWIEDIQAMVVNAYVRDVHGGLIESLGNLAEDHPRRERLAPLMGRLRVMQAFALVGMGQGDDVRGALNTLVEAIDESGMTKPKGAGPYVLEAALRRHHLGTAAVIRLDPRDLDAIDGLAPSP